MTSILWPLCNEEKKTPSKNSDCNFKIMLLPLQCDVADLWGFREVTKTWYNPACVKESEKPTDKAPDRTASFQEARNPKCTSLWRYCLHRTRQSQLRVFPRLDFLFSKLVTGQDNTGHCLRKQGTVKRVLGKGWFIRLASMLSNNPLSTSKGPNHSSTKCWWPQIL